MQSTCASVGDAVQGGWLLAPCSPPGWCCPAAAVSGDAELDGMRPEQPALMTANTRLFFAGEATSQEDAGSVHGALLSGERGRESRGRAHRMFTLPTSLTLVLTCRTRCAGVREALRIKRWWREHNRGPRPARVMQVARSSRR